MCACLQEGVCVLACSTLLCCCLVHLLFTCCSPAVHLLFTCCAHLLFTCCAHLLLVDSCPRYPAGVELVVEFRPDYPSSPPFVRIFTPRLQVHTQHAPSLTLSTPHHTPYRVGSLTLSTPQHVPSFTLSTPQHAPYRVGSLTQRPQILAVERSQSTNPVSLCAQT